MSAERWPRVLGATALLFLAGCATMPLPPPVAYTGDALIDGKAQLAVAAPRDRVLWHYRVGATALRRGDSDEAARQLDDALTLTRGTLSAAGDAEPARARRMFRSEAEKPFVGEPYERVMAAFYRGLVYWRQGEPDNARALFRDGAFIDSDNENKAYAGDWVLPDYLDGLATVKLGGDGTEALARARANSKHPLPDYDPEANVLVVVEFGRGPRKYAAGEYGEQLKFAAEPSRLTGATLTVGGQAVALPAYDDVSFQATTRGGRVMDHILGNKAVFKEGASTVGDAALAAAVIVANDNDHRRRPPPKTQEERDKLRTEERERDQAAVVLAAIGIFSKIASAATQSSADTRTWDNLPQYLSFSALRLPPGDHEAVLTFQDASGNTAASRTQTFTISVPPPVDGHSSDLVVFRSELPN
ncbi:MAG TPA: hypothetical protein VGD88_01395 [Opitutaceae bacterium]